MNRVPEADDTRRPSDNVVAETRGDNHPWEFDKAGREVNVRVTGQLTFNSLSLIRQAALSGAGLAYLPEDRVQADIQEG